MLCDIRIEYNTLRLKQPLLNKYVNVLDTSQMSRCRLVVEPVKRKRTIKMILYTYFWLAPGFSEEQ